MISAVTSQQQIDYYEQILNSIATAITTLIPVRDERGSLIDFTYKAVNRQWEIDNRKPAGEVVGFRLLDVYPHIAVSPTLPLLFRLAESGEPFQSTDFFPLEGQLVHYEIRGVRVGEDLVVSINNITPYWQAQQELKQQSELVRSVVNNAPVGIILAQAVRDSEGQLVDYSYRLTNTFNARLTGHTVEQMIGKRVSDLFPGWQTLQLFETFKAVTETGETQRYPFEYDSYGVKGWFEGTFVKQDDGVLFTFLDITAIKQAEVEQEIQAQRLKAILDNSQTAISLHEAIRNERGELVDFKTVVANRLALEQWGPLADQILHKPYSQISPNPNAAAEFARFKQVIETGETLIFEFNYAENWHLMAIAKMGDGLVISFINITAIHRYREQLETANQELKRSNESLQQFAYVASHDLQEPLRKIMAFGDMLTEMHNNSLNPGVEDLIGRMQQSAKRMSQLIRDLLDYSRISTQKDLFAQVDLNAILTDVQSDLEVRIRDAKAAIHIDPLPTIRGSAVQLQQLFQNLLSNAIKFGRKTQTPVVQINCQLASSEQLPADLSPDRAYWKLTVTDNGIGFDSQYAERIFQVFQRLHAKTQFAGTGVGLAICRKVVENHNGFIQASSIQGQGATFTVWLPV